MMERIIEKRRSRRIDVKLDGIVQFQRTNDTTECVIYDVSEDCMGVMIAASNPRICTKEDVKLSIIIPAERSPVKCIGKIVWYSEDKGAFKAGIRRYIAGIFISDISRLDRRRLELVIDQRKSSFSSGSYYPR